MKIDNCPLCGSDQVWVVPAIPTGHYVECRTCDLSTAYYNSSSVAIERWNNRPEVIALKADIEKFKQNNRYQRGFHDGQIASRNHAE